MKILLGLHPQKIVKSTGVFEEIFVVNLFAFWHLSHELQYSEESFFQLGHQAVSATLSRVLSSERCPE